MTTPSQIRVLIADDDPFVRRTVAECVNAQPDLAVRGLAATGEQAVHLVGRQPIDVAVIDVRMPNMDGFEAARNILANSPATQVVLWTAFGEDVAVAALDLGVAGFLTKTCSTRVLLSAIRTVHAGATVLCREVARQLAGREIALRTQNPPELRDRELEVLSCVAAGLSNPEIASYLFLSESTVKGYLTSLMHKFDVHTRVKLVIEAQCRGAVPGPAGNRRPAHTAPRTSLANDLAAPGRPWMGPSDCLPGTGNS